MHALNMIEMGAKAPEPIAAGPPAQPKSREFGKVLGEQNRAEQPQPSESAATRQQGAKSAGKQEPIEGAEMSRPEQRSTRQAEAAETAPVQVKPHIEPKLQHRVVKLLKAIAHGEAGEAAEEGASLKELLTRLVRQLDSSELKGEQVRAGVDLSALVELVEQVQQLAQLQVGPELQDGGELQVADASLEQLVSRLAARLTGDIQQAGETLQAEENQQAAQAEPPVAMSAAAELQSTAAAQVDSLAQARQILQQAIAAVKGQKSAAPTVAQQPAEIAEQPVEQDQLLAEAASEEIDPRFAGLLKPRAAAQPSSQPALRGQVHGAKVPQPEAQLNQGGETAQAVTEVAPEMAKAAEVAELLGRSAKPGLEAQAQQQPNGQAQPAGGAVPASLNQAQPLPQMTATVQLPSGQQVAEGQIFDQVVTHVSGSFNGASGRMVLRLQPAELGALKLELLVEGDRIRANLQAQNQQVQEVLERNLPQLRSALAEQGLKIDQFNVDVNHRHNQQGQFDNLAQQQHQKNSKQQPAWQPVWQQPEEQVIPLAHLMQNGGGGISLHV